MDIPIFERRKFVRIDVNLESRLNNEIRGVIKTLSLGGCLIETESLIDVENPISIKIFMEGKILEVRGMFFILQKKKAIAFDLIKRARNKTFASLM